MATPSDGPSVGPPSAPVHQVSWEEFYAEVRDVHDLNGETSIVKQITTNTARIRALELKFYAILAAVISSTILSGLIRWIP